MADRTAPTRRPK